MTQLPFDLTIEKSLHLGVQRSLISYSCSRNHPMPQLQDCPYCAEQILATAKKCKHCGEYLDDDLRNEEPARESAGSLIRLVAPVEVSGMSLIAGYMGLFALFPLVGIVPAIIGILTGRAGLKEIKRKPNLSGAGRSWFGIIMGVICLIFWSCMGVFLLLSMASRPR